jgi:hypothetical protein
MDIDILVAMTGCRYAKSARCPPFHLRSFAEGWLQQGISLDFCLKQMRYHLVTDDQLPWLDRLICTSWHELTKHPRAQPKETSRFFQRVGASVNDEKSQTVRGKPAAARAIDEAVDFLIEELSGGEVEARIIEANARDAGIAIRTLDRARATLRVISRRSGFGRNGKSRLSLPSAPKKS